MKANLSTCRLFCKPFEDSSDRFWDRDKPLRLSTPQKKVFNGWKRPSELVKESLRGSSIFASSQPAGNNVVMDLVQDITTDCSVIASICAATARFERGHGCVRHLSHAVAYIELIEHDSSYSSMQSSHSITLIMSRATQCRESTSSDYTLTAATEGSSLTIGYHRPKQHAPCSHLTATHRKSSGQH